MHTPTISPFGTTPGSRRYPKSIAVVTPSALGCEDLALLVVLPNDDLRDVDVRIAWRLGRRDRPRLPYHLDFEFRFAILQSCAR